MEVKADHGTALLFFMGRILKSAPILFACEMQKSSVTKRHALKSESANLLSDC